jgi:hypothetical protein
MTHAYERLGEFIDGLTLVDTHEHLPGHESQRPANLDVLGEWLTHYFSRDLVSAGLDEARLARVRDPNVPLAERWQIVAPYWQAAASTGYGRALALSAQGLYGIERIGADMELSNLAKNFPNVFIDMCWGHIISPEAARRALAEWLDAVPANKISAFGGDYCFVDGVYGHQELARRNVARTLAGKVADGDFYLDRAREIAQWLFVDNPCRLFRLQETKTLQP